MNRIFVMRNGKSVSASINGVTSSRFFEIEEEAREFFTKCNDLKKIDNVEELQKILDSSYRTEFNEILDRDAKGNVYLRGYNLPMPKLLVDRIVECVLDGVPIDHLVNFWKLCMTNPDPIARQDLFSFATKFNFPITDYGYFIAYKSVAWKGLEKQHEGIAIATKYVHCKSNGIDPSGIVVFKNLDTEELNFVDSAEELEAVIAAQAEEDRWNYSPHSWAVENRNVLYVTRNLAQLNNEELVEYMLANTEFMYAEPDFESDVRSRIEELGTLTECFNNISDMFQNSDEAFTDWHTKKMTINIGQPVTMPREKCDSNPKQTCSSGLHVGAPGYVSTFGGDKNYILAVLVNPANVVAVPEDYNFEKMRVCEYYPYALCEKRDGNIVEIKTTHFEEDYVGYEVEAIEKEIEKFEKKASFMNSISSEELESVVKVQRERLVLIHKAIE